MRGIRRKEKEISDVEEIKDIISAAKYITIAMCRDNEPYLVTLSHGFDRESDLIYFHCAKEGKKMDILKENNNIWGEALLDYGYQEGACDHLYATAQFNGRVSFLSDMEEKSRALVNMIKKLDPDPGNIIESQLTKRSISRVNIGKIEIGRYSGKRSKKVIIQT